jgi:fengycin family lipopeptide synthetase D
MILTTEKFEEAKTYWIGKLSGGFSDAGVLTDFPETNNYTQGSYDLGFNDALVRQLDHITKNNELSLYVVLLAAFKVLLFKYTGQGEIVVAAPTLTKSTQNYNKYIALKDRLNRRMTFKELLMMVNKTAIEGFKNQYYPIRRVMDHLGIEEQGYALLFRQLFALENIHGGEFVREAVEIYNNPLCFSIARRNGRLDGKAIFNTELFSGESIKRMHLHYLRVLEQVLTDTGITIGDIQLIHPEEREVILSGFNDTAREYPENKTIHQLFEEQVDSTPDQTALVYEGGALTYSQLNDKVNRLARYLLEEQGVRPDQMVGILMERGVHLAVAVLGILKAGAVYLPLDPVLPEERLKGMVNDADITVILSEKRHIKVLNRLQWDCKALDTYLAMDTSGVHSEIEVEQNELMDEKLWEYVGEEATDDISGGGWYTSYTGEAFTREEMDEYGDNILKKVAPLCGPETKILEIGCASGISMFRLSPLVGFYHGTDLSRVIIEKNKERLQREGISNIGLDCLQAHEIDQLEDQDYDIVIMNSVIQCFLGHNYFKQVIRKSIAKIGKKGYLFLGDVMDRDLKDALYQEMREFKQQNRDKGYLTNDDFSAELFLSRAFLEELRIEFPEIAAIQYSDKIHTIENELTKFRFDALVTIDKTREVPGERGALIRRKHQHDTRNLEKYSTESPTSSVTSHSGAYIIYTSGSTGKPKGVVVEHKGVVNMLSCRKQEYKLAKGDVALQLFSYAFDGFVTSFFTPLISGAALVIPAEETIKDIRLLTETIVENRVSHFICVPSFYQVIIENLSPREAAGLKVITLAGDRTLPEVLELTREKNKNLEIVNEYGVTEASVMSTIYRNQQESSRVRIGAPIWNTRIYVLDKHNAFQPIGVPGEVCIAGAGLAREYLGNPGLTAEKFITGPVAEGERVYKSGDYGRWMPDGTLELVGRIDHQVKIRGFRIELGEIESQLTRHSEITHTVVVAKEKASGDSYLCAYFVSPRKLEVPNLKDFLSKVLPEYMIPSYFVQLDSMPLTISGKIDRRALPEVEVAAGENYVAPRDEFEEKMVVVWAEVLGLQKDTIGIDANFFEFGGHSLKAVILVAKVHEAFDNQLPLAEVFAKPTVREITAVIKEQAGTPDQGEKFQAIQPAEPKEWYTLSSAQKRLYVLQQMDPDSVTYNMPHVIQLAKGTGKGKLAETFGKLSQRHESLRTTFEIVEDQAMQKVHPAGELVFELEEYRSSTAGRTTGQIIQDFVKPFDLAVAPLVRAGLVETEEGNHLLMVDMHHIISDGFSVEILTQDFNAFFTGRELSPLRIQYKDYAQWQEKQKEDGMLRKQEEYWLKQLEEIPPSLQLPLDYERPSVQSFEGQTIEFEIGQDETGALNKIAAGVGATVYMTMLAVTNIFLAKICNQEDIVVGTPVAGRGHADLDRVIGMFVNSLVLRNRPASVKTFEEFLKEVKDNTLDSFENQDYQFEDLVDKLTGDRDSARNPLFDVMFAFQAGSLDIPETPRRETGHGDTGQLPEKQYFYENKTAAFDIYLNGVEVNNRMILLMEYSTTLFKEESIRRLIGYFKEVVSQVAGNKDIPLEDINISHDLLTTASTNPSIDFDF